MLCSAALFIAYLAAHATQAQPGAAAAAPPLIAFSAHFGAGFYWFAVDALFLAGVAAVHQAPGHGHAGGAGERSGGR